ncbi:MAG: type II secretion system protein [Clostridia bacterium]|nr:type II secretion system protein [Clostridia bacterium]
MKDIRGNRENRIIKNSKGFTLLETLLVVAIIVVLLGVSIMGVVAIQKELRQRELDSKAEVIYMAAQNRLMELKASGRAEFYSPDNLNDVHQLGLIPLDSEDENRTEESLFYVTSNAAGAGELSTAAIVLPESRVEKEIRDNNWVIEYDPASGSVYAVFYSEDTMEYTPESFNDLRIKQMRKKAGAKVGY